jgi:hypothetical protein
MLKTKLSTLQKRQLTPLKNCFFIHYLSTDSERQGTKDPTQEYDEKEPMSPAKIKQHEPTAVSRDPSDQKIVELGKERYIRKMLKTKPEEVV